MRFDKRPIDCRIHKDNEWSHVKRQYFKHLIGFMKDRGDLVYICGFPGYYLYVNLKEYYNIKYGTNNIEIADAIWIFDYIESCIDPFEPLYNIRTMMKPTASVYVTCPHRSWYAAWNYNHFHEMDYDRFAYLVGQCGFKIVRHEAHTIWWKWYKYIGIRPLIRLLFARYKLHLYELKIKD